MTNKNKLPILTLKDMVVFPNMVLPLFVGREHSLKAIEACMELEDKKVILLTQKNTETNNITAKDLYNVGTVASILQLLKLPDKTLKVLMEGEIRVKVKNIKQKTIDDSFYLFGEFEELNSDSGKDQRKIEVLVKAVLTAFERYVSANKRIPIEVINSISNIENPSCFADAVAANLVIKASNKQYLLECLSVNNRLEKLLFFLEGEIEILRLAKRIQISADEEMHKKQREYYLHEQLDAIRKELSGNGDNEIDDYQIL